MTICCQRILRIFIFGAILLLLFAPLTAQGVEKAPDFTVKTTGTEEFTLSEQEEPVLIEFMTPLCSNCEQLEENLQEIYPEYEGEITFISIDISDTSLEDLRQVKEEKDIPWKVGRGDAELFAEYQGSTVPKMVILDQEGFITFEEDGVVNQEKIETEIEDVIAGRGERQDLSQYGIYGLAIVGGATSFFSPCSFPLLPSYIAYYVRDDKKEEKSKKKVDGVKMGLKASLGIVLVFGIVGSIVVSGGVWLREFIPYLQLFVGTVITFLGILLLSGVEIGTYFERTKNKFRSVLDLEDKRKEGHASPFYYGLGYGAGSAGCTAPAFVAVLLASWLSSGVIGALLVLLIYLMTMSVLMLIFSVLVVYLREGVVKDLNKAARKIDRISGIVLLGAGIYLIYLFYF